MLRLLRSVAGTATAQAALAFVTALQAFLLLHSAADSANDVNGTLSFGQFSLTMLWLGTALSLSSALFGAPLLIRQTKRASALFWQLQLYFACGCALFSALLLWLWQAPLAAQIGFALAHGLALVRSLLKQLQQQRQQFRRVALQDLSYAMVVCTLTLWLFVSERLTLSALGWLNALLLAGLLLCDWRLIRQLQRLASQRWHRPLWWRAWQQQGKAACAGVLAVELLANSYLYMLGAWHGAAAVAPVAAAALLFRPVAVLLQGMLQQWRPQLRQAVVAGAVTGTMQQRMQQLSLAAVLANVLLAAVLLVCWPALIWPAGVNQPFLWLCLLMALLTALRAARQTPVLLLQAQDRFAEQARAQWPFAVGVAALVLMLLAAGTVSAWQADRLLLLLIVAEAGLYLRLRQLCVTKSEAAKS
ncbi:hypothetical protein [Rheinheimera tilapiae]|uniref:Uncharacterized protein n=1 Tax=Rheinheimera tilapiae TaxID=875043 RepID=A0ABV6BD13_9GAMM